MARVLSVCKLSKKNNFFCKDSCSVLRALRCFIDCSVDCSKKHRCRKLREVVSAEDLSNIEHSLPAGNGHQYSFPGHCAQEGVTECRSIEASPTLTHNPIGLFSETVPVLRLVAPLFETWKFLFFIHSWSVK
ncbi:hypothetical protein CDAR_454951 [Caerostris darwini]|uniref:Uncharacterized protein n=1 Tax=Caerostris darwini TaxID=1538125 RepID=A0AAV4P2S2_9ARAC|nr:hypothetical protein CDAR_454951 [Caerostris darwini]